MSNFDVTTPTEGEKLNINENTKAQAPDVTSQKSSNKGEKKQWLVAQPPADFTRSEEQVEVSNGPAFNCLDENFQQGKITGTEVAQLKACYMELFDNLKKSRENEFSLINLSKQLSAQLDAQNIQLAHEAEFPENIVDEIGRQREQYLQMFNRLSETEERVEELRYQADSLKLEKRLLQKEFTSMSKTELEELNDDVDIFKEMEKRLNAMRQSNKELKIEIEIQQRETKKLKDNLKIEQDKEIEAKAAYEEAKKEVEKMKADLNAISVVPAQYSKETEKMRRKKTELQKEQHVLDEECGTLRKQIEGLQKKKMSIEVEIAELHKETSKNQQHLFQLQKNLDDVLIKTENAKQQELELRQDKAVIDLQFRQLNNKKKNLHDETTRLQREKEGLLRANKKAELHVRIGLENLLAAKQMHEKARAAYEIFPRNDNTLLRRIEKLQNESNRIRTKIAAEISMSATDEQKISHMTLSSERLFRTLTDLRSGVIQLTRVASQKAEQRERKSKDLVRAQLRFQRVTDELKNKGSQIAEQKKRLQEVKGKLNDFAKLYNLVKTERNKAVHQLQTTTQKVAEMREKLRLHNNEADITRTLLQGNERRIQKERMKYADAVVQRDSKRYELCKRYSVESEQKLKRDQLKLNIQRLNAMVNQTEEDMVNLKKISDRTEAARNEGVIRLIEKNEEVYILQEKTRVQETMMRYGEIECQARQEEINFLKRHLCEENRVLELLKKKMPTKLEMEQKYKKLIVETNKNSEELAKLERKSEDPNEPGRLRFLSGTDPSPMELQAKLEQLEARLIHKEEKMLEKDLVYEAVSRLVDNMQRRSMNGREETLKLAKSVNSCKSQLITLTKKMKATTAEMTIYMTEAKDLKEVIKNKQRLLDESIQRMKQGLAPNQMAEEQWRAIEQCEKKLIEKRIQNYREARSQVVNHAETLRRCSSINASNSEGRETLDSRQMIISKEDQLNMSLSRDHSLLKLSRPGLENSETQLALIGSTPILSTTKRMSTFQKYYQGRQNKCQRIRQKALHNRIGSQRSGLSSYELEELGIQHVTWDDSLKLSTKSLSESTETK